MVADLLYIFAETRGILYKVEGSFRGFFRSVFLSNVTAMAAKYFILTTILQMEIEMPPRSL